MQPWMKIDFLSMMVKTSPGLLMGKTMLNTRSQLSKTLSDIAKATAPRTRNAVQGGPCVTSSNGGRLETVHEQRKTVPPIF